MPWSGYDFGEGDSHLLLEGCFSYTCVFLELALWPTTCAFIVGSPVPGYGIGEGASAGAILAI